MDRTGGIVVKKVYNWEDNTLHVVDTFNNIFKLEFRGIKTIVYGSSASGKTFLYNVIKSLIYDRNRKKDSILITYS